jgi:hypothetical protein
LRRELVWLRDTRRQIRRYKENERDFGGEETGGDAGGVFGAGHGNDQLYVRGRECCVSDRIDVDVIGGLTPSLHLLGYFLDVRGREDTDFPDSAQCVGEVFEEAGHGVGKTDRGEDTGTQ